MESPQKSPGSPDAGWLLVERPRSPDPTQSGEELRAAASSPQPSLDAGSDHDDRIEDIKSPASESLADDVLREPLQLQLQLQIPATAAPATVEEPATPTAASTGPGYNPSCGDLHAYPHLPSAGSDAAAAGTSSGSPAAAAAASHWNFERQRAERLRAASRHSEEGALEGFQDPQPHADDCGSGEGDEGGCGAGAEGEGEGEPVVTLGWDGLLGDVWALLSREAGDLRASLAATAQALWERLQDGRLAVEEWAATVRRAARQAAKTAGASGCPLWALLGVGGLAAVALAALASQVATNRRISSQLRQRDRDLARLVVKILNLQDALQSAARAAAVPVLRHAPPPPFTTTTLIGMV
ncbi:hypothetical protein HYH03_004619 [Edaphochlamys debaryana]|uniref:Uncharacterized protein n=1 Tax=Edaphochlamys debaryana TaxID=47281 RepID=A0A835YH13_9CHLO|nr:hypothetical protein HYH03_004619 [Edaphochlamys debaryana]|eukprot:KAG2497464.1 hypothetical protein HYH03_004619 [Edaphochlamys debaryana]